MPIPLTLTLHSDGYTLYKVVAVIYNISAFVLVSLCRPLRTYTWNLAMHVWIDHRTYYSCLFKSWIVFSWLLMTSWNFWVCVCNLHIYTFLCTCKQFFFIIVLTDDMHSLNSEALYPSQNTQHSFDSYWENRTIAFTHSMWSTVKQSLTFAVVTAVGVASHID